MSDNVNDTQVPDGEDVGDISSGHGNPDPTPHISDTRAEDMLNREHARSADHPDADAANAPDSGDDVDRPGAGQP